MMICVNIGGMGLFLPLAFMFSHSPGAYYFSCLVVYLVLGSPWMGFVFQRFSEMAHASDARIRASEAHS